MDCSLGRGSFQYHRKPFEFALLERPGTHLSLQTTTDLPSARSDEGGLTSERGRAERASQLDLALRVQVLGLGMSQVGEDGAA